MLDTSKMTQEECHTRIFLTAYGRPELLQRGYTANQNGIFKDGECKWINAHGLVNRFIQDTVRAETLVVIPEEGI